MSQDCRNTTGNGVESGVTLFGLAPFSSSLLCTYHNTPYLVPHAYMFPHLQHSHTATTPSRPHRLPTGAEYLFSARDDIEMTSWVDAISRAIQKRETHTHTYVHIYAHTHTHTHTHVRTCIRMHLCAHACMHTHTCTHTHAHTHTYTHICTPTHTSPLSMIGLANNNCTTYDFLSLLHVSLSWPLQKVERLVSHTTRALFMCA